MAKQNWKASRTRTGAIRSRKARWSGESGDRWQLAARLAFPGSLLIVFLILFVAIVQWINPVPPPKLILLTTRNATESLPPNAAAAADARMLQSLGNVFDVSDADAEPVNLEQMRAIIDGMRVHTPRQQILAPWKPTTTVFYINAIGIGLQQTAIEESDRVRAWLVPGDFDPTKDPRSQLVPLADLVESIAASSADQKLVVLDCQRPNVHSYFGVSGTQFVDAAIDELQRLTPETRNNLYVLFSSSPDEVSWPMHPESGSVFGHFFSRGISGEADRAGDSNDRVTLAELVAFVNEQVSQWTAGYCLANQRPQLIDFGQNSAAVLIAAGRNGSPVPAALPPDAGHSRSGVAAGLERNWTRYFDLNQRSHSPFDWAPVQWSYIQDRLLLAERLYRSRDYANADLVMHDLDTAFDTLENTHQELRQLMAVASPASAQFLSRCCATNWPEVPGAVVDPAIRELVRDVAAGGTSLDEAAETLADSAQDVDRPLEVSAHFLRLIAQRIRQDSDFSLTGNEQTLRDRISLRQLAEDLAQPEHPLVDRWLHTDLESADAARRNAEDNFLRGIWAPQTLGPAFSDSDHPRTQYVELLQRKKVLSDAFRLRDRLLVELPFWISFLESSQPHHDGGSDRDGELKDDEVPDEQAFPGAEFPRMAADVVESLLGDVEALSNDLLVDPEALTTDERNQRIERIVDTNRTATPNRDRLIRQLRSYADTLSQERLAASTGDTWRRIDSLLRLPLPMLEGVDEAGVAPRDLARFRMQLVDRTGEELLPTRELDATAQTDGENEHAGFITRLHQRLHSLPDPSVAEVAPDAIRQRLIDLVSDADEDRLNHTSRLRAELAFRLLRRGLGADLGIASPVINVRTGELADSLLRQSIRVVDDFYAAVDEHRRPYYEVLASGLLSGAVKLRNAEQFLNLVADDRVTDAAEEEHASSDEFSATRKRLQQLDDLLQSLQLSGLETQPDRLKVRATVSEFLEVNFPRRGEFPAGIGAISVESMGVAPVFEVDDAVRIRVERPTDASDSTSSMNVIGYFRGHRVERTVPLEVITGLDGNLLTYDRQNVGDGRLRMRARPVAQDPLQLLFVLDCSGSMSLPDQSGEPRMAGLRSVLTEFAGNVDPESVQVGVRVFGHRHRNVNAPEAHTDTELILPVGTFGPARLQDLHEQLRPVGHSPIFNALIQSRDDFSDDGVGRREIVLISDGADNWALAGLTPGIDELAQTYLGTGVRISAIGYQVESFADYSQLQQIALSGDLNGRCVTVESARSLLRELAGLAGLPGYRILRDGQPLHEEYQFTLGARSIEVPPGEYAIEVVGPGRDILARKSVRILPGEAHELLYDAGTLTHEHSPHASAVAVAHGHDDHPDLVVLEAQRIDNDLMLDFGLLHKPDNLVELTPLSATIGAVGEAGHGRRWHLRHLRPNVTGRHYPAWSVRLVDWPLNATGALLTVAWNDLPGRRLIVPLDWNARFTPKHVGDGILLTRRSEQSLTIDGIRHDATALTFVLEQNGPGIERWGVTTQEPTLHATHNYDHENGIYNVQIVLQNGLRPDEVSVIESETRPSDRELEVLISLGDERINR